MTEELIAEIVAQIAAVRNELADKIKALEARSGGIRYRGTWTQTDTYAIGDVVTDKGSCWHCSRDVTGIRPGEQSEKSRAWVLMVKRGSDAPRADRVPQ